jgi:uncharacterized protein
VEQRSKSGDIGRRNFLRGSLAAAASLGLPAAPLTAEDQSESRQAAVNQKTGRPPESLGERERLLAPHARFRELQLGSVRPEGWLKYEMEKQANGITRHQTDFCFPFDRRYWASNERGQDEESRNGGTFWYPWEQTGYWADGAYRCAKLIDDPHLRNRALEPIHYTVEHPVDGWFLGPRTLYDLPPNQDPSRWPQAVFFRALAGAAEGENSSEILDAMCRHYLEDTNSDYQHGPFGPRDRVNIESILWCYAHSGNQHLLEKAQDIWSKIPDVELRDLTADRPAKMHGVSFAELSKLGVLMFLYTGDPRQLDISVEAIQRVFKYHMLADGTPSTTEGLRGTSSLDGHETCDIVEFNLVWGCLLMATGSGNYADRIERALFNAGMGAVRKDWSGMQYISCPNQLHIARNSCQVGHIGTAAALYGPNSDHRPKYKFVTACCAGNVNRMLPTYLQRAWMSSADGGLAAVLYGPSRVAALVGVSRRAVEIVEETSYPFSERITFRIHSSEALEFPLYLRIPGWCQSARLLINRQAQPLPSIENGFIVLRRMHSPGDVIRLELPMHAASGRSSDGGVFLERGPLVYSLQPEEEWTPIAMPEFEITSPDYFPMWAAIAKSPWNYGLAIDESAPIDRQVCAEARPSNGDFWNRSPIALEVPVRRIQGWDLARPGTNDANSFMTPSLPEDRSGTGPVEKISLVPLGSTQLRLTVFPLAETKGV